MSKILVTGKGSAGSWKIRGEQLGAAIGAKVVPRADAATCADADIIIAVKRLNHVFSENIKRSGKPWIWDLVDFYPQPFCTDWTKSEAIKWVQGQLNHHRPDGVIWANQKMSDDCDIGIPSTTIYHHHRAAIKTNPIREHIARVGYEGEPSYLGEWLDLLLAECKKRRWDFMINPPDITDLDVVVAVRGAHVNGYAQQNWKSNVKLANAQGSGTPFVGAWEPGYQETDTGGAVFVDGPHSLKSAFDALVSRETRARVSKKQLSGAYSVDSAAADLKTFAEAVSGSSSR